MQKFYISVMTVAGLTTQLGAQGLIYFDGTSNTSSSPTATSSGKVFLQSGAVPVVDANTDINVELAYGTTPKNVSLANAVTTLLLSSTQTVGNGTVGETLSATGDITAFGNGQIWDNSNTAYKIPNEPSGSLVYFEVFAWTGKFSSYTAAQASGTALTGASGVFSEWLVGGGNPYQNNISSMPALVLKHSLVPVPEPSTGSMMGLGGIAFLALRHCNRSK
jgi:hypothetical protein